MDRFREMQVFRRVVDAGGMTAAARSLGMGQASVSRIVADLEARLGSQLLRRGPPLVPTEAGRAFHAECGVLLDRLEEAEAELGGGQSAPAGLVRVTCNAAFGQWALIPMLPGLLAAYPGLTVELTLESRVVNLVEASLDVAIRIGSLQGAGLVGRRLGQVRFGLYAAPDYLVRAGRPGTPGALADHDVCLLSRQRGDGAVDLVGPDDERARVEMSGRFYADGPEALQQAALSGLGVAILPVAAAEREVVGGRLVRVLPGWERPPAAIFAVWPETRFLPRRVRVFVDHVAERIRADFP